MREEDLSRKFIKALFSLVTVRNLLADRFFYTKLTEKIFRFSLDFINLSREEDKDRVAQYKVTAEKCLTAINILTDMLTELRYLNLVPNSPAVLKTEYNLLAVKLEIIKKIGSSEDEVKENYKNVEQHPTLDKNIAINNKPKGSKKLTENKKKILNYIKSYPNTRTKDIIYEFNAISGRTVKRNLNDLLRAGLVRKRVDNKAVYYYINE